MNNKGFTLIELIAIIIIISVITILSFSSLTNTLKNTKLKEIEDYKLKIEAASQIYVETKLMRNETFTKGTYFEISVDELLNNDYIRNDIEVADKCTFENTKILVEKAYDNTIIYNVSCDDENIEYINGMPIYFNPVTGLVCDDYVEANSVTGINIGCMKWYTFNDDSESNTVNMILDHNTTAKVAWNSSGNNADGMNEVATALTNNTSNWTSGLSQRLITADEVADIVGASSNNTIKWNSNKSYGTAIETQSSWIYLDGGRNTNKTSYSTTDGWQKRYAIEQGTSNFSWLFDRTNGCTSYGCSIIDVNSYGYWTSTTIHGNTTRVWRIYRDSKMIYDSVDNDLYGVRPVITISKSLLQ